jgi:hypothetical protein
VCLSVSCHVLISKERRTDVQTAPPSPLRDSLDGGCFHRLQVSIVDSTTRATHDTLFYRCEKNIPNSIAINYILWYKGYMTDDMLLESKGLIARHVLLVGVCVCVCRVCAANSIAGGS